MSEGIIVAIIGAVAMISVPIIKWKLNQKSKQEESLQQKKALLPKEPPQTKTQELPPPIAIPKKPKDSKKMDKEEDKLPFKDLDIPGIKNAEDMPLDSPEYIKSLALHGYLLKNKNSTFEVTTEVKVNDKHT